MLLQLLCVQAPQVGRETLTFQRILKALCNECEEPLSAATRLPFSAAACCYFHGESFFHLPMAVRLGERCLLLLSVL
jgi:hypothetical protein